MNPKLSVIIPVYNTLPYLKICFDSIKRQKYEPMEVIVVDDGSTDGSGEFCDEYAKTDSRFYVVHKENGGLSSARNAGIERASGELITFVDSDDALIGQPYLSLIDILLKHKAQIICMDRFYCDKAPYEVKQKTQKIEYEKMDNLRFFEKLCSQTISEAAWDKIYDISLFSENRFAKGVLNEDFLLMIQISQKPIQIIQTNYLGYYYFKREGSITGSGFKQNMIDALYNADYAYSKAPTEACKNAAEGYLLRRILMFLINMPKSYIQNNNSDYLFAIKRLTEMRTVLSGVALSKRDRYLLKIFSHFPSFTKSVVDIYMKGKR